MRLSNNNNASPIPIQMQSVNEESFVLGNSPSQEKLSMTHLQKEHAQFLSKPKTRTINGSLLSLGYRKRQQQRFLKPPIQVVRRFDRGQQSIEPQLALQTLTTLREREGRGREHGNPEHPDQMMS